MIRSMTSFGEASCSANGWTVRISIKTLNHKYLEIKVKGLEEYERLELQSRDLLQKSFVRGRIEVRVELQLQQEAEIKYDLEAARRRLRSLQRLVEELKLADKVSLDHLLSLEGVLQQERLEEAKLWPALENSLLQAIAQVLARREREGHDLKEEVRKYLAELAKHLRQIEVQAPQVKEYFKEKLRQRALELLKDITINEDRLEEEAVLFAERSDVTEEVARLKSHLQAAQQAIEAAEPAGRVLDFLAQEMYREVNTIGSKAKEAQIARWIVEMKSQIEKLREQVRNIE